MKNLSACVAVFALMCVCGANGFIKNIKFISNARIIGGEDISISDAKHQVIVTSLDATGTAVASCGGVLIKPNVVLTLAVCLPVNDPTKVFVLAGLQSSASGVDGVQALNASKVVKHVSFNNQIDYNIGLVKLDSKFDMTNTVGTVPVATSDPSSTDCSMTGWEVVNNDVLRIRSVNLNLISKTVCAEALRPVINFTMDRVLCTKNEGSYKGPCPAGTGGALMCNKQFVGLASFDINCDDTSLNFPSVFTEVKHFQKWAEENGTSLNVSSLFISLFVPLLAFLVNSKI